MDRYYVTDSFDPEQASERKIKKQEQQQQINKNKRKDSSFVAQPFMASVANTSSKAHNINLSYITEHLISFNPLGNRLQIPHNFFKKPLVLRFQQYQWLIMNDTK